MTYYILAVVEAPDDTSALRVAEERLGHDDDYGFPYTIERFKTFSGDGDRQVKFSGNIHLVIEEGRTVWP